MCGIWASFRIEATERVIDAVSHRGPDGRGWEVHETSQGKINLGHRRLAIIDTRAIGIQPMKDTKGRFTVVFNGEIYNFRELRSELEEMGVSFRTNTDTEVLLEAYQAWGRHCLSRLKGMFAFAIWDRDKNVLFVARDRFGIKPLFWSRIGTGIAFASEARQFLEVENFPRKLNVETAFAFLSYGLLYHTDDTLFENIHQVPAGCFAEIQLEQSQEVCEFEFQNWYQISCQSLKDLDPEKAAEQFLQLINTSITEHKVSDVDVGFSLSGGMDSSLLTVLGREDDRAKKTFSAIHDDPTVSEEPYIRAVVEATGVESFYTKPDATCFATNFDKLIEIQEAPISSTSVFAQWSVYRLAAENKIKVIIDGQGADEFLAGYPTAFPFFLADKLKEGQLIYVLECMSKMAADQKVPISRQTMQLINALIPESARTVVRGIKGIHRPSWMGAVFDEFRSPLPNIRSLDDLRRAQMTSTSLPKILHCLDRNSMSHSVEARVPMLDSALVDFAFSLPEDQMLQGSKSKLILRRLAKDILPKIILDRKVKSAFSTPSQEWLKHGCAEAVENSIRKLPSLLPSFFEEKALSKVNDPDQIWRLASFASWLNTFEVTD
jgi:asparagine synthase (glutamine-hydrolysing)